jgi:hypothetical protein
MDFGQAATLSLVMLFNYPITFTTTLKRKEFSKLLLIPMQSLKIFCLASNNAIVWKWKRFGSKSKLESFLKMFDQARFWKPNQTTSTWVFLCLNDGEFVNLVNAQAICFVLCYIQAIILIIFFL